MGTDEGSEPSSAADPDPGIPLDVVPLHSANLLTVLDENGIVQYESPSIARVFGYDQDDLVGDPVDEYFHPSDRERVMGAFRTVVASEGDRVESAEYRHERADGSYTWVESVASADPTPGGYYVVNTRDVSARKAREQELERTNERLDRLARVVSHDLRNPLNVARGRLDLVREHDDSEHLAAVDTALERMETLVDGLLALARQGHPISETERVTLSSVVDRSWAVVDTREATLTVDGDLSFVADADRLAQLVENLFRNAVEHGSTSPGSQARQDADAPEDAVEHGSTSPPSQTSEDAVDHGRSGVTVRVGALADGAGFYVADDGPGIPEGDRDEVFVSGYSTAPDGTGFGLAIVTEIAGAHGWDVRVTEGATGGARFEVTGVETET